MPHPNAPVVVRVPSAPGALDVLDPATDYPDDHEFVLAYPRFFVALDPTIRESVPVEAATANPGEKRSVRRR